MFTDRKEGARWLVRAWNAIKADLREQYRSSLYLFVRYADEDGVRRLLHLDVRSSIDLAGTARRAVGSNVLA